MSLRHEHKIDFVTPAHHGSYKILHIAYWKLLPSVVSSCNYNLSIL